VNLFPQHYYVPLATPYWDGLTFRAILRCLFSGRAIDGPELRELRFRIMDALGVEDAILCGSGSMALELALRTCDVRQGDEVIIPTFCCTSVVSPILAVGASPVLADIGSDLNLTAETVEAVLSKRTRAIIVPHLFGNPANIDSIIDLARKRDIRVIDDAAQALGATCDGRPLGSFGDAGILSFGNEKVCSGLGGGVFVSRYRKILRRGSEIELAAARFSLALRSLSSTLLWRRWRRWSLPLQAVLSRARATDPGLPPAAYRKESMSNLNAAVASSLMRTLRENIAERRARVGAYQELLGTEEGLILLPHRAGSACLTQIVRVLPKLNGDDLAAEPIAALRSAGYEVQGSYIPIHLLAPYQQLAVRSFPCAEQVWTDLIELPCEPDVKIEHVERIAWIVKQTIKSR
jgi:dTDP-4-amino-4,6-dideoxygalactose transaminase